MNPNKISINAFNSILIYRLQNAEGIPTCIEKKKYTHLQVATLATF